MRYLAAAILLGAALIVAAAVNSATKDRPEQYLSQYKIYSDGSPLRRPIEDWDGARRRARSDRRWSKWVNEEKRETDEWIAKRRDRVEWIAGWWHNFVSPKDGSFLVWTPDEPGKRSLRSRSDELVELTPELHAAWVYGFRIRHADYMQRAAMLYRLTGERRYAEWVASQLDFYANNYTRWPIEEDKGLSRLMYQSLDEAVLTVRLINAARLLDDYVTAERKQQWNERLFRPTAGLLEKGQQRVHNIACWHRSAVGHIAIYSGDQELWELALKGPFGIRKQLAEGVTADFLWYEQSLTYNSYVVQALAPFFTYAALSGKLRDVSREMAILQNLMLSPLVLRFPTGRLPTPADTTAVPQYAPNVKLMASVYRIFPTLLGLSEAGTGRDWNTLVDPPGEMMQAPPLPPAKSINLEASRMAVIKKGLWQVYLHYGQLGQSHSQAEALNYEAFYGLTDITHDPGTVGYGSPLHRGYFTTGLAHNVPLVGGLGQKKWNPGKLLSFDGEAAQVAAAQPEYQPDVSVSRDLEIQGYRLIDTVKIKSPGKDKTGLVLHVQGRVGLITGTLNQDPDFGSRTGVVSFRYWSNTRTGSYRDRATLMVRYPDVNMKIRFEVPGSFTLTHAVSPDTPPGKRETLYLETSGSDVVFRTIFEPVEVENRESRESE
ncbi:MAG: heparinase [Acidobacteria bacterium]|nr:MAG: heparinase [Acidobacteriota bacterium]